MLSCVVVLNPLFRDFLILIPFPPELCLIQELNIFQLSWPKMLWLPSTLSKFYPTTEKRIVSGISLLSSIVWINQKLYFPLFSSLRTKGNLTKQFVELLKRIPFRNTILLMDGGILCCELFFEAVKLGYTVIGRLNPTIDVVLNGVRLSLTSLRKQTKGTTKQNRTLD